MEWERDVGRMVLVLLGVLVLATAVTTANATLPGLFRGIFMGRSRVLCVIGQ